MSEHCTSCTKRFNFRKSPKSGSLKKSTTWQEKSSFADEAETASQENIRELVFSKIFPPGKKHNLKTFEICMRDIVWLNVDRWGYKLPARFCKMDHSKVATAHY